jgi:CheY-like chemotaxis protein
MQELPKMQEMLNAALAQASQECGTLLGQELVIQETVGSEVTRDGYFNGMEYASFIVKLESLDDYRGALYLVLSFRDAIVLSGTLLGVPPARIMEKKKLAIIEPDDVDAFTEIANQLTGSFNTVFKRSLPKKAHLKQTPPKKFVPKQDPVEAEEPVEDGDYYLLKAQLSLTGTAMEQLDILIPLPLAKLFDLRERTEDGRQAAKSGTGSDAQSPEDMANCRNEQAGVLILDDNAAERQQFQELLAASGVNPVGAALNADLKKLLSQQGLKAILVGISNANDQELSICLKLSANLKGLSVPIIMCAREWTRSAVLKALKYGAGDVMMTPSSPEELTSKVLKMVNAT